MIEPDAWPIRLRSAEPDRGQAIEELRSLLLQGLSRSLNNRYGSAFLADDIVQEALLKILSSLDQFEGRCPFIYWAMTIATRIGIRALRRKHTQNISLDMLGDIDMLRLPQLSVEGECLDTQDERQRLLSSLSRSIDNELTARQRICVRGFLEGLPVDELAERMGSNRNATYKLLHDARIKLKQCLQANGFSIDAVQSILQ